MMAQKRDSHKKNKTLYEEAKRQLEVHIVKEILRQEEAIKRQRTGDSLSLEEAEILFHKQAPKRVGDQLFLYSPDTHANIHRHALCRDLNQHDIGIPMADESLWYGDGDPLDPENRTDLEKIQHQLNLDEQSLFNQLVATYPQDCANPLTTPIASIQKTAFSSTSPCTIEINDQQTLTYFYATPTYSHPREKTVFVTSECHLQMASPEEPSKKQSIPGTIIYARQPNLTPELCENSWEYQELTCDYLYAKLFLQKKITALHFHHAFTWVQKKSIDKAQWKALSQEDKEKILWLAISLDTDGLLTQMILKNSDYRRTLEQCSAQTLASLMRDLQDRQRAAENYLKSLQKRLEAALQTSSTDPEKNKGLADSIPMAESVTDRLTENAGGLLALQPLVRKKTTTLEQLRQVRDTDCYGLFAGHKAFSKKSSGSLSKAQQALLAGEVIYREGRSTPLERLTSFVCNVTDPQLRALTREERYRIAKALTEQYETGSLEQNLLALQRTQKQLSTEFNPQKRQQQKIALQKRLVALGIREKQIDQTLKKLENILYVLDVRNAFDAPLPSATTLIQRTCIELLQGRPSLYPLTILSSNDLTDIFNHLNALKTLVEEREALRESLRHWVKSTGNKQVFKQKLQRQNEALMRYGVPQHITVAIINRWLSIFTSPSQYYAFIEMIHVYRRLQKQLYRLKEHAWKNRAEITAIKQRLKQEESQLKAYGLNPTISTVFANIQQWMMIDLVLGDKNPLSASIDDLAQIRQTTRPYLPLPRRETVTLDNPNPTSQPLAEPSNPSAPSTASSTSARVLNFLSARPPIVRSSTLQAERAEAVRKTPLAQTLGRCGYFAHRALDPTNSGRPNFHTSTTPRVKYGDSLEKQPTLIDYLDLPIPPIRLAMAR
ncbi:MAG: hypothetical protein A2103_05610 [Gammaproteobacteria bacterium GWF2_41_13]|nr:MAG: hypothetical protein A2103_05610 [Gammaproteobacteria bacterium GWF2_41_13]